MRDALLHLIWASEVRMRENVRAAAAAYHMAYN